MIFRGRGGAGDRCVFKKYSGSDVAPFLAWSSEE